MRGGEKPFPYEASVIELWKEAGRDMSFTVSGTSMEPILRAGDRVTVRPVQPGKVRRGDIIAFRTEEGIIIHRVVGKGNAGGATVYWEKGDNLAGGARIDEERIIGRVTTVTGRQWVAEMDGYPWRWLNPALGLWGAGWAAFGSMMGAMKRVVARNNQGALVSGSREAVRKAQLFLPRLFLGLFRDLFSRRRRPI